MAYALVEIVTGTFVYEDTDTKGRYICPVCYEDKEKTMTLRHLPAWSPPRGVVALPMSERLECPKCNFVVRVNS